MSELREWDTSAANNNDAPPDGFPENMNYSAVNNAAREVMAVLARFERDTRGAITAGGTANAITVTPTGSYAAYFDGMQIGFTAANTNTGATTLNVGSVGAVAIVDQAGNALAGGEIVAGGVYQVVHDGTQFRLRGSSTPASLALGSTAVVDLSNAVAPLVISPGTGQHLEIDGDEIQSKSDATTAAAISINRLGGSVNIGPQSGTGTVNLYHSGALALQTDAAGVDVRDTSGSDPILALQSDAGADLSQFRSDGTDTLIRNITHSGHVVLQGEDSGGTVRALLRGDPDAGITAYHAAEDVLSTRTGGVQIHGDVSNANPILEFVSSGGSRMGYIVSNASGTLIVRGENNGENVILQAEDAGGTARNLFVGDPDGAVTLYYDGSPALRTASTSVQIISGADDNPFLSFIQDDDSTRNGFIQMGTAGISLQNEVHGANVSLVSEDTGGTDRNLFIGDPDGSATLYYAGTARLQTDTDGATVLGDDLRLNNTGAGATRLRVFNSEGGFILLADGDTMQIRQADAAGADEDTWIAFANNGAVSLYFDNTARIATATDGVDVTGTNLDLAPGADSTARIRAFNTVGGVALAVLNASGNAGLYQTNSSGTTEEAWITTTRNGQVGLNYNGTQELVTQDSDAAGNTSGAQVRDRGQTLRDVGFNVSPLTNVTAAYTLQDTTVGGVIRISSGTGDIDITTATTDLAPDGSMWTIVNESGSNNTIDANTGITLTWQDGAGGQTGDRTLADGGVATVYKRTDTQYLIWGNGLS